MRKQWIYVIQLVLLLLTIIILAVGCENSPSTSKQGSSSTPSLESTPIPPTSNYPAEISGCVTIAEKVMVELPKSGKKINYAGGPWWIIDVSVKNKDYEQPITSLWNPSLSMPVGQEHWIWSIVIDDKVWSGIKYDEITGTFTPTPINVHKGQVGKTTFLFTAPNVSPSDAEICYRGQEPHSYGKLTFSEKVTVYDWDLKKAVQETQRAQEPGELYVVPDEHFKTRNMQLRTVERWTGSESRVIEFDIDKSPWVINGSYDVVSSLGHKFEYLIFTEDEYSVPEEAFQRMMSNELIMPIRFPAGDNYLVKQSGKFFICVYASGVNWQLKVGVE